MTPGWKLRVLGLVVMGLALLLGVGDSSAERRVALVIGNGAYGHAPALRNPGHDADGMAALLDKLGFEVESGRDLNLAAMQRLIRRFGRAATGAELALVFYAGHGLQVDGENWLLPVDARLEDVRDLEFEAVNLTTVLRQVEGSAARVVVLDACRDNPLAAQMAMAGTRSVGRGLARVETADVGTLIAFATSPGATAADGDGRNSPFTAALLEHLGEPGLEIRQVMTRVRQSVRAATGNQQTPWENASLIGEIYLAGVPPMAATVPPAPSAGAAFDERAVELAFWEAIKDSASPAAFEAYLTRYPQGTFAPLAQLRLAALGVMPDVEAPVGPPVAAERLARSLPVVQTGHMVGVLSLALGPGKSTIVTGSDTLRLWDHETGQLLRTLSGHSGWVQSVAISPDGRTVASGSSDGTIKLWDIETGRLLRTLSGHSDDVESVAISPDGRTVASGSEDNTVKLWDIETGRLLRTLSGHAGFVQSVAISPDGRTVASGSWDDTVKLWNIETGRLLRTLSGHSASVESVAISPDGRTVASGSWDNTVKLWEIETGRLLRTLSGHSDIVWSVAISPDGRTVVSGSNDHSLRTWHIETGRVLRTLSGHSNWVGSSAISPDGRTVISGNLDNTLRIWNLETNRVLRTLSGHSEWIGSLAISPDGRTVASGSDDKTLKLWDLETGHLLRTLSGHSGNVRSVAISPDGRTVASGSHDNTLKLWDLETGRLLRTLSGHSEGIWSVAISPDGRTVVSGSYDKTLKLWDLETGRLLRTLSGHSDFVGAIAISPDGRTVASGSGDKSLKLWDLATGRLLRTSSGHSGPIRSVAMSVDGRSLTFSTDGELLAWDIGTNDQPRTIGWTRHGGHYSPDGRELVILWNDGWLCRTETETGAEIGCVTGFDEHDYAVRRPDGRWSATAGALKDKVLLVDGLEVLDVPPDRNPGFVADIDSLRLPIVDPVKMASRSATLPAGDAYRLGVLHARNPAFRDIAKAATLLDQAAQDGDVRAMRELGLLLDVGGEGLAADAAAAAEWLMSAHRGGDAFAANDLEQANNWLAKATREEVQRRLQEAGHYDGTIDGDIGPASRRALEAFAGR